MNEHSKNKLPSFSQWRKLPRFLSFREKTTVLLLAILFLGSATFLYMNNTKVVPARGGSIAEGIVGSPRFLNPVYADANDADRDLVQLLFAGLMKYNDKGEIVPDLAEELRIEEGGKVYELTLREKLLWSDGKPFSVDDILFTVRTIQDPRYKSPIRANWIGVDVQKVSERVVRFQLNEPFAPFVERLTLKLIPEHIWGEISPENFALSVYNLKPIGMGPYRLREASREDRTGAIKEVALGINPRYHDQKQYIQSFTFRFFDSPENLKAAFDRGDLQGFTVSSLQNFKKGLFVRSQLHTFSLPRYFAVFFNLGTTVSTEVRKEDMRSVFALTIDKQKLVADLLGEFGKPVNSPLGREGIFGVSGLEQETLSREAVVAIAARNGYEERDGRFVKVQTTGGFDMDLELGSKATTEVRKLQECLAKDKDVYPDGTASGIFGSLTKTAVIRFQEKYASEILTPNGLKAGTGKVGPSTRDVLNRVCFPESQIASPLKLTLHTIDEYPLKQTAELLRKQWEAAGITVDVKLQSSSDLERDTLKPRAYEALLFGEILGLIPDPFPFWHSSQKRDPGLNLSQYDNKNVDKLLEQARKEIDAEKRKELLQQAQDLIVEDIPALFLFDSEYVYVTNPTIKGINAGLIADPSQRFSSVEKWYINTARAWK